MPDDPIAPPELHPVHDHPDDPPQPLDGSALCLSGGGYRAMLFHLGTIWRLNELHYLQKLKRVSSVSGGSITSGVLAQNWTKLGFDGNGFAQNFDQQITQPIRKMASESIDISSVLEGVFGGVSEHVATHYKKYLFGNTTLQGIPDDSEGPRFVFNATSLQTGVLWRFSKPFMGDWKVGLVMKPTVELATAVAASSAFPPILSPCVLNLDPNSFDKTMDPPPPITSDDYRTQVPLCDGGVYDNLGLETAWKQNKTILVSDGGGALDCEPNPKHDWLSQTNRVLMIVYSQVVILRKRSVIELFNLGVRNGTYWGVASNIKNYQLANALVCPFDVTTKLAQTATRLTAMDNTLQEQLIDWGYAICDAGMRRWLLPDAPAPAQSPYGTFKKP
jgi:NTE family protein